MFTDRGGFDIVLITLYIYQDIEGDSPGGIITAPPHAMSAILKYN